ncbi:MAG: alpha/beta hydrolase [Ruminococcaceae bacterium]|nr:alpha/beta hydrolase [Oscillospiraceae bacterium]
MFEAIKARFIFDRQLGRPDINKAYAMVGPEDSWYQTIKTVHDSLASVTALPHETLEIKSHDGLSLKAIYYPAAKESQITVICAHGYTSHAEREWAFPALFYLSLGYNVLIPYQRAHGMSEGERITFGALEHRDMMGWVEKANQMIHNGSIIIHGLSMGGGIVLYMSDKQMQNVKCLISDAPSISIKDFFYNVSKWCCKRHPDKVAEQAIRRFKKLNGVDPDKFDAMETVKQCKYPLLLSAGSNEKLEDTFYKIAQNNPSSTDIIILPGCNHGNGMYKQTELYQEKIKQFIARYL